MRAALLQVEHHGGKVFGRNRFAHAELADGIVLAEDAPEVAVRKEDGARTAITRDGRFLAVVEIVAGHLGPLARPAESLLTLQAVDRAVARAQPATLHGCVRLPRPLRELTGRTEFEIRR